MNTNNQFSFVDWLSIMSFCIGLMNLQENMTQNDKQELLQTLSDQTKTLLDELHAHLQSQDDKIDLILNKLEGNNHDS